MSSINLTHHFLIAMPNMADPHFSRTLTYICEHNDQGALGLVVNRPIDMTLQALFERLSLSLTDRAFSDAPIYFGGPVQTDRGFVLHEPAGNWQATLRVGEAIGLPPSKDILEAGGPARARALAECVAHSGSARRHPLRRAGGRAPARRDGASRRRLREAPGRSRACLSAPSAQSLPSISDLNVLESQSANRSCAPRIRCRR